MNNQVLGYLRVSHPWFEVSKPRRQLVGEVWVAVQQRVAPVGSCQPRVLERGPPVVPQGVGGPGRDVPVE